MNGPLRHPAGKGLNHPAVHGNLPITINQTARSLLPGPIIILVTMTNLNLYCLCRPRVPLMMTCLQCPELLNLRLSIGMRIPNMTVHLQRMFSTRITRNRVDWREYLSTKCRFIKHFMVALPIGASDPYHVASSATSFWFDPFNARFFFTQSAGNFAVLTFSSWH